MAAFPPTNAATRQFTGGGGGGGGSSGFYQSSYADFTGTPGLNNGASNNPYSLPPSGQSTTTFDDEPPLLEELGVNIPHIIAKAKAVMNPLTKFQPNFADEADMSGPILFYMLLGFLLLLRFKVQFGTIYGLGIVGTVSIYVVINLMSSQPIDLYSSTSIVGYALLPMVFLAAFSLLGPLLSFRYMQIVGYVLAATFIAWSTSTAAKIFVAVLSMHNQFWLIAYPLALMYTSFAFIIVLSS